MAPIRSKRLRLLDGMCRTLCDLLNRKVGEAARGRGWMRAPNNTSAIYTMAQDEVPGLLDQLINVQYLADKERGVLDTAASKAPPTSDVDRKKMLSAVRASIYRTQPRFGAR